MATWLKSHPLIAQQAGFDPSKPEYALMRDCRVKAGASREGSDWAHDKPHITKFLDKTGLRIKIWPVDLVAEEIDVTWHPKTGREGASVKEPKHPRQGEVVLVSWQLFQTIREGIIQVLRA